MGKEARRAKLNFNELKSGGFIKQTQKDLFTVRLRCPAGLVTSEKLRKAAEIADRYGRGEVHLTVRQSVEVPWVNYRDFDAIVEELRAIGWSVASCGPRARVPTACAGCSYNPNGLVDTQGMCLEVDRRYFGTPTGLHKFKVSFSGCPIDCFRTREMDLGFQGVVEPELVEDICNGCELCVRNCEDGALQMVDGLPVRDPDKCIGCGDCVKICPVDAMVMARKGWLVRVGGKHGKHPLYAYEVANLTPDEGVFALMEKTLEWYRENGKGRERIGAVIARVGVAKYVDEVVKPLGLAAIERAEDRRKYRAGGNFHD
ncbi:MAG: 4Fe-4S binding protein [Chloroflexi bacterium]|nr:4Fe-4S binding protein [Chloroflexota bacterium]